MFRTPMINLCTLDIRKSVAFYADLGFTETFRTPREGEPVHVELTLDGFTMGIATVEAAINDHGLQPDLNGRAVEIVLWADDVDAAFARLTAAGSRALSQLHDFLFLDNLRVAWATDPDGNPLHLVQKHRCFGPPTAPITEPPGSPSVYCR